MKTCKICEVVLTYQKSTCSWACRALWVNKLNTGKPSPHKGKTGRWTAEQREKIGAAQRGKPKSEAFRKKCSDRMKGKPSCFKGHKHDDAWKAYMSKVHGKENHHNWKGGIASGENKAGYSVRLRREQVGFSPDVFRSRLAQQNGLCAICDIKMETGLTKKAASADHCHATKTPRGILCKTCNLLLGHAKDDIAILQRAISYLESWNRAAKENRWNQTTLFD